ncbi:ADP-ribosylglycohydrolase [Alteromonas sp. A081]|uniref:ADP-ribosylglycohydrolase n=1 Tax=Alteromonas sp. A081 TaxID=3410269 RepID=UPI003B9846A4
MYKGNCKCQAVHFELADINHVETHSSKLLPTDDSKIMLETDRQHVIVDCAPSSVARLHTSSGETHHVCNICGSLLFVEVKPNTLKLEVMFAGHSKSIGLT